MLCLIRFSGTDYIAHLSFREFVDAEAMLHGWNIEEVKPLN